MGGEDKLRANGAAIARKANYYTRGVAAGSKQAQDIMARSEGHVQRNNALREGFLKPLEFAASAPPTGQTVSEVCKEVGIEHFVEEIPNSTRQARLHWLGKRNAQKTLLYFHGG